MLHDVGVVILSAPINLPNASDYGTLPSVNQFDSLKTRRGLQDVTFTAVGYGLQESFPDQALFLATNTRTRMSSTPYLLQINTGFTGDFSLLLSNNAHSGGTCFGDSGGPNFYRAGATETKIGRHVLRHQRQLRRHRRRVPHGSTGRARLREELSPVTTFVGRVLLSRPAELVLSTRRACAAGTTWRIDLGLPVGALRGARLELFV